jgi:hypothetical protein
MPQAPGLAYVLARTDHVIDLDPCLATGRYERALLQLHTLIDRGLDVRVLR